MSANKALVAWLDDDGSGAVHVRGTHDAAAARVAVVRAVTDDGYEQVPPQLLESDPTAWWALVEPVTDGDGDEFHHRATEADLGAVPMLTWHP